MVKTFRGFIAGAMLVVIIIATVWVLVLSPWRIGKGQADSDRAAVVLEIRELQRYETALYIMDKIIDARSQSQSEDMNALQRLLFEDRLLLIARGEVIAGFDMSRIANDDIRIDDDSIVMTLPQPEILVVALDEQETQVYDRQRGLLTAGDNNLETEARQQAERAIRNAACDAGIMETATRNGIQQVETMLKALQFKDVTVNVPSVSTQTCKST